MGCCSSQLPEDHPMYSELPMLRDWMREFHTLALSEAAIEKFYKIYKKIDLDESGSIEIKEMLVHFDIDRTKFTKRVFGVFDEDNSGEVDFREFVMALWNYCTLGKATLVIFAFDLYDSDGSGVIEPQELDNMLKEVYGRLWHTNAYANRIATNIQGIAHSFIDIEAFGRFVKKHPALLFPAYDMQRKLQKFTLGQVYWKRLADKRLRLSNGEFVPIKKFMDLHLEKLIREDKTKYQTDRMLTFAKSTSIKPTSEKEAKSGKSGSESTRVAAANQELLPRRMSSVNVDLQASAKEAESSKSSRRRGSALQLADGSMGEHKGADIMDITTEATPSEWVSASRSSKGGGGSRKRGTNNMNGSDKYNLNVKDKSPQVYRGDALNEALRLRG